MWVRCAREACQLLGALRWSRPRPSTGRATPTELAAAAADVAIDIERARILVRPGPTDARGRSGAAERAAKLGYAPLVARAQLVLGQALLGRRGIRGPALHEASRALEHTFRRAKLTTRRGSDSRRGLASCSAGPADSPSASSAWPSTSCARATSGA